MCCPPASTNRRFPALRGREPMPGPNARRTPAPAAPRGAARASGIAPPVERDERPIQIRPPVAAHDQVVAQPRGGLEVVDVDQDRTAVLRRSRDLRATA